MTSTNLWLRVRSTAITRPSSPLLVAAHCFRTPAVRLSRPHSPPLPHAWALPQSSHPSSPGEPRPARRLRGFCSSSSLPLPCLAVPSPLCLRPSGRPLFRQGVPRTLLLRGGCQCFVRARRNRSGRAHPCLWHCPLRRHGDFVPCGRGAGCTQWWWPVPPACCHLRVLRIQGKRRLQGGWGSRCYRGNGAACGCSPREWLLLQCWSWERLLRLRRCSARGRGRAGRGPGGPER